MSHLLSSPHAETVVSGMRTTGHLHLGHYHGILKNWLKLQYEFDCYFFAADWHALTTQYEDPSRIHKDTWTLLIEWLALGLDPDHCTIFIQSWLPEHAELHLLLSMITPLPWLERVPTFKDQQAQLRDKELNTYGFLGYPLLQSADVLLYGASWVPVGEDQVPHIELTREVARRFNYLYGHSPGDREPPLELLKEPQALLSKASKFLGLDGRKMSKSYHNTIGLCEEPESISLKIRTMPTDPARVRRIDPGTPEKCPVWNLHQIYSSDETKQWVHQGCTTAGIGCLDCKKPVIESILYELQPIRERAEAWREQPEALRAIAQQGAEKARLRAQKTLQMVRRALGLSYE